MVPLNTVWKGSQVGNTDLEGTGQKPWVPWVLDVDPPPETGSGTGAESRRSDDD